MNGKPILLTGAAGNLGQYLRPRLVEKYGALHSSDRVDPGPRLPGEEHHLCDLADFDAINRAAAGCWAVIHFGARVTEEPWEVIHQSNIIGTYNVFEAARRHGIKRVVFASSVHAIGYHQVTHRLDASAAQRPDSYYGIAKAFGEGLACMYAHKAGMDVACLRIGSSFPEPTEPRHLSTWLSYADMCRLVMSCLEAPKLGYTIMYGVSANTRSWWDNSAAPHVAYRPEDNAEVYAARILANAPLRDPASPAERFQGGYFCAFDHVKWQ